MSKRAEWTLAAFGLLVVLSITPTSEARARDCPTTRGGMYHVSACNMSCSSALRLISRVHYIGLGATTARLSGWSCTTTGSNAEGGRSGAGERCRSPLVMRHPGTCGVASTPWGLFPDNLSARRLCLSRFVGKSSFTRSARPVPRMDSPRRAS